MAHTATKRKQPRTFSLSEDVIGVLERYKSEKRADSLTSAVEEIVREWTRVRLAQQVTAYYDNLSDEEAEQEKNWGAFSEAQL